MKTVLLDTNVVLDFLLHRPSFTLPAVRVLSICREHNIALFVSSLSFSNMAYILRKELDRQTIYRSFAALRSLIGVAGVMEKDVDNAIVLQAKDFEDALQYFSALSVGADCIVTRNVKDFLFATIPVLLPSEFLAAVEE